MPWSTPTLRDVRSLVRDAIRANLPGADASIPNSVLRVMSDAMGALCHLTLQFIDWLSLQLLPDTAEHEFLDRHGDIWLKNADGTTGRKGATLAAGSVTFTGTAGTVVPLNAQLAYAAGLAAYETTQAVTIGSGPTACTVRALDPGIAGNRLDGDTLVLTSPPPGADSAATVVEITGGVDEENDDDLRTRILLRIQQPPMGGDSRDFVLWTLAVPGVTRAWCFPLEQGVGTTTIRFMMDDLRSAFNGFPQPGDIDTVKTYIDSMRPVAVKDCFVVAPIPWPVDVGPITLLVNDDSTTRGNIQASLQNEFYLLAPGNTVYRSRIDEAISAADGEEHHELQFITISPPGNGYLPILGNIIYE